MGGSGIVQTAKQKVDKAWTTTKKVVAFMMVWGLIFSLVTIGRLRVAFDYDDTLVFSTPAFNKAFRSGVQPFSTQFWQTVNSSYDIEKPKLVPYALAWVLRVCGFHVTIIAARPSVEGEPLRKEWRHLASQFVFSETRAAKHSVLKQGNYVLYFGDSDSDITEGRLARVFTVRVRRSAQSSYKEDYRPGTLNELVLPLSQY
ncbi:MAG: hypothetical protein HY554_16060 [Elusimicrobia bacterium]|nr:hypothetical protein [Elusimicrobiota bacterium]